MPKGVSKKIQAAAIPACSVCKARQSTFGRNQDLSKSVSMKKTKNRESMTPKDYVRHLLQDLKLTLSDELRSCGAVFDASMATYLKVLEYQKEVEEIEETTVKAKKKKRVP